MKTANTHRLTSGGGGSPPKTRKSVLSLDRKPKEKKKKTTDLHGSALRQHQSQQIFQRKGGEAAENPSHTWKPADRNRSHCAQHWGPLSPAEWLARATLPTGSWRAPPAAPSTSSPLARICHPDLCLLPVAHEILLQDLPACTKSLKSVFTPLKICLENTFEKQGSFKKKWQV